MAQQPQNNSNNGAKSQVNFIGGNGKIKIGGNAKQNFQGDIPPGTEINKVNADGELEVGGDLEQNHAQGNLHTAPVYHFPGANFNGTAFNSGGQNPQNNNFGTNPPKTD